MHDKRLDTSPTPLPLLIFLLTAMIVGFFGTSPFEAGGAEEGVCVQQASPMMREVSIFTSPSTTPA